jgi:hypothetical protein
MSKPQYEPPIAWDRFGTMLTALYEHIYAGKQLDVAIALEISEALYRLRALYQTDLKKSLPNRRATADDLRSAQLALLLVDWYGVNAATAMEASTGKPNRVDAKSVARTLENRRAKLYGDAYWPTPREIDAAVVRLRKMKKSEG